MLLYNPEGYCALCHLCKYFTRYDMPALKLLQDNLRVHSNISIKMQMFSVWEHLLEVTHV